MAYCEDNDLYLQWGKSNARKWADLENTGDNATILARLEWAREEATAQIDDRLRHGPYAIPFTDDPLPRGLVRHTSLLAGVLLYESRGVVDAGQEQQNSLRWAEKRVEKWMRDVHARIVKLDVELTMANEAPLVVDDPDDPTDPNTLPELPETYFQEFGEG